MIDKLALVEKLIEMLVEYVPSLKSQVQAFANDYQAQRKLLRGLMNMHSEKNELSDEFFSLQDTLLQTELSEKKLVTILDMKRAVLNPNIYLYQGDITELKVDAIVNAANSRLLGCFQAGHNCIDNCIHSAAGLQLRFECNKILQALGDAPSGSANITSAYNLPCKKVIHVVGPIIRMDVTPKDEELLASCYTKSLALARENGIKTLAFCCISTGVFSFPNFKAANIAVNTVNKDLQDHGNDIKVIFNVFEDKDLKIYQDLLDPKEHKKDSDLHPTFNINLI